MSEDEVPTGDPLIEGIVTAMMAHAAPNGAVDYPKAAAAFAQLLAEMIAPQSPGVRQIMLDDFERDLAKQVRILVLRLSVVDGGREQ